MVSGHNVGSTETQGEGEAQWKQWPGRNMHWAYKWSGEKSEWELKQLEAKKKKKKQGKGSHLGFRYVDDTCVKIGTREVEAFTNINTVDSNIKFTREDVRGRSLPFFDCSAHWKI